VTNITTKSIGVVGRFVGAGNPPKRDPCHGCSLLVLQFSHFEKDWLTAANVTGGRYDKGFDVLSPGFRSLARPCGAIQILLQWSL
jgi:hypothetical protein